MKKFCILTTVSSSINNWIRPIFEDYKNLGVDLTVVANMSPEFEKELNEKYPYVHTKSFSFPRGISIGGSIKGILALKKFFKKEKFDLIEYHTPNASLYASIAGKMTKIPVRIYGQWGLRYVSTSGIKRKILKFLEKLTCKYSTHVKAQSFKNRQFDIDEKLCKPDKVSVIGIGGTIGVNFNEFDISKKQEYRAEIRERLHLKDEFVFGYIGRIHVDKGINELLDAFKKVKNSKLLLIGDLDNNYSPTKENLQFISDCEDIIVTGRIPHEEVCKYISALDVLVHPTYREGFGHILQEAMTMAVPVITTDIPGPSEVVCEGECGIIVPVKDSDALAEKMNYLKSDKNEMQRLSKTGRERAEKYFEQSIMVGHIIEDYKNILDL